ncbi:androgen-induced gene 1 protein isoform X2 [Oncorhynchus mykiss]|uniref:androgen-induced gene 1 protein isoform X2 n=2 Tax=Oncorhynchus TaxID=8016 RepID=UPI001877821C|nr:androgen-induced gene 1 protein isoform X2 [Oncorhynchus mykiss]XP_046154398.1 androgen-induced gene 1 protein-like isoform X3 [Oncorhynchus gorbuscha]
MALIPSQVLRVAILLSYFSILCNYKAIDMPAHQTYGGSWKFLTFIDLVIQAVFFGVCVLTDLSSLLTKGSESQEQERQLRKLIGLRDWMMAVLAFPVGVMLETTDPQQTDASILIAFSSIIHGVEMHVTVLIYK